MLSSVGIAPGWRVLDAGCGSGSYLSLLAGIVGPLGYVQALDLASDNVALVEERFAASRTLPCLAQVRVGDRKSTRLNSSHANISYAVFCLKKKKTLLYVSSVSQ